MNGIPVRRKYGYARNANPPIGIRTGGMEIPLTQGKTAVVDPEDYETLSRYKWFAIKGTSNFYAVRSENGNMVQMHHDILGKPDAGYVTDHEDGNGLNNRRYNISHVTKRQNCLNRHHLKSSRYPGVYYNKERDRWNVQIYANGKKNYVGKFKTEDEAAMGYQAALVKYGFRPESCGLVAEYLEQKEKDIIARKDHDYEQSIR
jgi:hypothetical protein